MATPLILGLLGLVILALVAVVHHRPRPKLYLSYSVNDLTLRSSNMQIQAKLGTTQVFDVIAKGSQGENMNVPMDFVLSNPAVASLSFDQVAMTLTLAFTGLGQSDLTETASGTSITTVHQVEVTDVVVSVDLQPHVEAAA